LVSGSVHCIVLRFKTNVYYLEIDACLTALLIVNTNSKIVSK
jgi:hypothetical protein